MRRLQRTLFMLVLVSLPVFIVFAQPPPGEPPPIGTQDAPPVDGGLPPDAGQLPPGFPTATPGGTSTGPGQPPVITETPIVIPDSPESTEEVVETVEEVDVIEQIDSIALLIPIRADLDLLADSALGVGQRPAGWSGLTSTDINNPDLLLLSRLDLEVLVGNILGADIRPEGWFGAVASTPFAIARDIRHDLELLADVVYVDEVGGRPAGWNGDDPIYQCGRATQTLVQLLELNELFSVEIDPLTEDYCEQVEVAVSQFAELNLLANPVLNGTLLQNPANVGPASINSEFAVAFIDRSASQRLGVIPNGTGITPVGKSPAQFSNMMLVRGQDFEVFVDYQFTTVTQEEFNDLPATDTIGANAFCNADWCAGN